MTVPPPTEAESYVPEIGPLPPHTGLLLSNSGAQTSNQKKSFCKSQGQENKTQKTTGTTPKGKGSLVNTMLNLEKGITKLGQKDPETIAKEERDAERARNRPPLRYAEFLRVQGYRWEDKTAEEIVDELERDAKFSDGEYKSPPSQHENISLCHVVEVDKWGWIRAYASDEVKSLLSERGLAPKAEFMPRPPNMIADAIEREIKYWTEPRSKATVERLTTLQRFIDNLKNPEVGRILKERGITTGLSQES